MTFDKLFNLLGDNQQTKSLITNISKGKFEMPYLITETIRMLSDESPYLNLISDTNKVILTKMLNQYYDNCMHVFIDDLNLEKILKYGKIEVYKVEASNGVRYATSNEVANGVKELLCEYLYPASEECYKMLCLLNWTFTGRKYYFTEAGFKLTYISNKDTKETLYDMIQMSAYRLKDLFEWAGNPEKVDTAIKEIKKRKTSGFKYASYAKDEIEENVSIKQLIYNIDTSFPRNSTNPDYRKAIALMIKGKENFKNLSPLDIAFLRKVYHNRAVETKDKEQFKVNEQLKQECEELLEEQYKGKISPEHFAYKIISTLKKKEYRNCSIKQYSVIKDALDIVRNVKTDDKKTKDKDVNNNIVVLDDNVIDKALSDKEINSIEIISDQLGDGLLFDDILGNGGNL